jgi:ATP-dependent Lhr-like helicase
LTGDDLRWWTWAGYRANATLAATLGGVVDPVQWVSDLSIRLRSDLRASTWPSVLHALGGRLPSRRFSNAAPMKVPKCYE